MTLLKLQYNFLIIAVAVALSCNTTDPPVDKAELLLKLEDVSCTEAWITLTTNNLQLPAEINLTRTNPDGSSASHISILNTQDSLLYIDSLLPNQSYIFQALLLEKQVTSNKLSITTLDTTSQNFSFEVLEFGDGFESSYFNDVWVFEENNIWVCGYIYDPAFGRKNIMHWDGNSWEPLGIQFNSSGIDGIWAQDSSKIYFAAGFIIKYDNGNFTEISLGNIGLQNGQRVEKLWGSSESNIYGVGPWGTIVRYDGTQWSKIEFDMQWYFYEITGNKETGIAYAIAINQSSDCIVVKLENAIADIFYQQSTSEIKIFSVTLTELNNFLYIPNDWQNSICRISEKTRKVEVIYRIKGSFAIEQSSAFSINDIYYVGPDISGIGVWLFHFNGISYKMIALPSIDRDNLGSLHAIKDLAVSVGFTNNKAYLILIRR
jgi:hypothetical protein